MDGIHDLGGKTGYGPVDVNEPEEPFHNDYEGRMWAMSRIARAPQVNIDWWRHIRELIDPDDYLNRPYFDSWAQTTIASMIDADVFSREELQTGISKTAPLGQSGILNYTDVLEQNASLSFSFEKSLEYPPKFVIDDTIKTCTHGHAGHTRLPEYARGKTGVIHSYRGAHIFADDNAKGVERSEHLYTVIFTAQELWGPSAHPADRVSLELWESYLVG